MKRFLSILFYFSAFALSLHLQAENTPLKEGSVDIDGAEIYYKRIGQGYPIIVIHGGPGHNSSYFMPQFETLAGNHELIFYDQRGSGKSFKNLDFNKVTLPQFVSDLEALRKELKLNHFVLIGHSWGAFVAAQYARKHPKHVSRMVLMNPMPASSQDLGFFAKELESRLISTKNPAMKISKSDKFLAGELPVLREFYGEIFKEFLHNPVNISSLNFSINQGDALQGFLIYRIFEETLLKGGYDFKHKLKDIETPTLILHGDSDPIPQWTAKETAHLMPNAKFKILEDCGHFPHIEQPNIFFNEVNFFLKGNI
ncbi:MAG: Proline iminopeptidase [Chlamydiae bacterium]|nr:Proline iminopeptidase [Chlamydiota bacterium]